MTDRVLVNGVTGEVRASGCRWATVCPNITPKFVSFWGSVLVSWLSVGRVESDEMIFRWHYRRKLTQVFGGFVPKHTIKEVAGSCSEWESFKLLLPRAINRLLFTPTISEVDAVKTLQKMMLDALHSPSNVAGDEHDAYDAPREPN